MKSVKVSLDESDVERLEKAAGEHGVSLSEEIRIRVLRSFDEDQRSRALRGLFLDIESLAAQIAVDTGLQWDSYLFAWKAFRAGIDTLLSERKTEEETDRDLVPGDDADTVGRVIARGIIRVRRDAGGIRRRDFEFLKMSLVAIDARLQTEKNNARRRDLEAERAKLQAHLRGMEDEGDGD